MDYADGKFAINISDDGKGFDSLGSESKPESPAAVSGDGLNNMCQRLADIGGRCLIKSSLGRGTNIRFVIELNHATKEIV